MTTKYFPKYDTRVGSDGFYNAVGAFDEGFYNSEGGSLSPVQSAQKILSDLNSRFLQNWNCTVL